jgi:hypothetical protein
VTGAAGTAWSGGGGGSVGSVGDHSHSASTTVNSNTHTHPNGELAGTIGQAGVTDAPSYTVFNYIIKT